MWQVASGLNLPEEIPEGLVLELHRGRWAVTIKGTLYVFPQETTKPEAEEVLRRAYILHTTRKN